MVRLIFRWIIDIGGLYRYIPVKRGSLVKRDTSILLSHHGKSLIGNQ